MNQTQTANSLRWSQIPDAETAAWNERLSHSSATLYQFPFWNGYYQLWYFKPVYVVCLQGAEPIGYACILRVGPPGFRMGVVVGDPVSLAPNRPLNTSDLEALAAWAGGQGYALLRFSLCTQSLASVLARSALAVPSETFPFMGDRQPDLVVALRTSEEEMLASFTRHVRRKVRLARELGYELRSHDDPEQFTALEPLFEECSRRKGFRLYRSFRRHAELLAEAARWGRARVYSAHLDGRPVACMLVLQDGSSAHAHIAATDPAALNGRESPACLLHWTAMRESLARGAEYYNFGPGPEGVGQFKRQFNPIEVDCGRSVALVTNPHLFGLWKSLGLPLARGLKPMIRRILSPLSR
jgi:hypothetical protein